MGEPTEDALDRLRAQTADHIQKLDRSLHEARTRKGSWTGDEIEYWLHPALHLIFITLLDLGERLTNLEDYVIRAAGADRAPGGERRVTYLTGQDRQDLEATVAFLRGEEDTIRRLADLNREVTPVDRVNIATELLRFLDRFIGQENKLRALEGEPPIPTRDQWGTQ